MDMNLDKIAGLARIKLKADEKAKLSKDFEKILGYVKQLEKLDTGKVPPTSHVLSIEDVFREDAVKPKAVIEDALKHAPAREGQFYRVPKVIETE